MKCRDDRVRHLEELPSDWNDDLVYEILVNPHSTDKLLMDAMDHASAAVLERAVRHSVHVANLRSLSPLPDPTDDSITKMLAFNETTSIAVHDKLDMTKRLCKATNGDWRLAERVADWLGEE